MSCSRQKQEKDNSLKNWILSNQDSITADADALIKNYFTRNKLDSNWMFSTIAITKHGSDPLSVLASKVHDSTGCIVVELTFYKDSNKKKRIMLAMQDSSCLPIFNSVRLETDSTNEFIFGKTNRIEN
jgi:hypothetical protein